MSQLTWNVNTFTPRQSSGIWTFEDWIVQNARPFEPKQCSNALPYRWICLANALPKEQSASALVVFNKACV